MNKKRLVLFAGLVLAIVLASFLVSAQTEQLIKQLQNIFTPLLKAIFGETTQIFEQLLFALIIIAIAYMALDKVDAISDRPFALWTVSIAVAILAVRFIATEGFIDFLLFPQGVFGIALLAFIPFLLYFWFVEFGLEGPRHRVARKIAWSLYAAVFAVLWYQTFVTTTNTFLGITLVSTSRSVSEFGYIYLIAAGLAVVNLLFDKTIQSAIARSKLDAKMGVNMIKLKADFSEERVELNEKLRKGAIDSTEFKTLLADLNDRAKPYNWKF